jgi:membrane-associated protease RseP (regulator of RpoE activity)
MDSQPPVAASVRVRRRWSLFAKDRPWLNALLFLLTAGTAFLVGLDWGAGYLAAGRPSGALLEGGLRAALRDPRAVGLAILYAAVLMLILASHEMGHYAACRHYGISATLPFFVPAPTLIGTMGAFIKIRDPIARKRQLFDIGAAGPLAGFLPALAALAVGLTWSKVVPALPRSEAIVFGEPLIVRILSSLALRGTGPGFDVILHPVAFAGWVGMLVTALNLFPMGQLDGGHVAYAVLGPRARHLARGFLVLFLVMGALFWLGWWVWGLLILVMGIKHPRVWDEPYPLGRGRMIVAVALIAIFALCFIPAPVKGLDLMDLLGELGLR